MEPLDEEKNSKRPLTDAERAQRYRQKQRLIKEGAFTLTVIEQAKQKIKLLEITNLKELLQMEEFEGKIGPEDEKVLANFIKNRKQKLKIEGTLAEQGRQIEASIQEKIQKIANYEFAELQKVLSMPHPQPERRKIILGKLDENLFLFMDYMKNNEPPYSDFLKDVVEAHGHIEEPIFIKLFVIVCMRYEGQELQITRHMAEQAMVNLNSGLPNIQASFGLLRLLFHNLIDLADFKTDLLIMFQSRYDQTISSFIKSIPRVKRSVIDLLPSTIFLFSVPVLKCLKSGADILHKQIPLDFLPLTIEIVCYSFCQDQNDFEQFLTQFKKGCLAHFDLLRETEFINVLYLINNLAIDRTPGYFGSLAYATQAIQRSFELIGESKIDKFDSEITEKVVSGGHDQFQLIKSQPKILLIANNKNLQRLAREVVRKNEKVDFSAVELDSELSEDELKPFELLKMRKLLEIQHIALRLATSSLANYRLFASYQTGKGKTALCLGLALLKRNSHENVFLVNQSQDLLFRDFKIAQQAWSQTGINAVLCTGQASRFSFNGGIYFIHTDLLFAYLKTTKTASIKKSCFIFDEFDSSLLHPKCNFIERAQMIKQLSDLVAFTGSDLQQHHVSFIEQSCQGTIVNLNFHNMEENPIQQDKCEVFSLIKAFRQRIVDIAREKVANVPVIIVLSEGSELLQANLQKASLSVFNLSSMDSSSVESTMRVFTIQNSGQFSVFIINDEQGRGLDFQTTSQIEKNGGIYLIIAQLPDYYLQFKQYVGRTGRIGNKGVYSVILYEKDSKNIDGAVYLEQRIQKLKNDDFLIFQKTCSSHTIGAEAVHSLNYDQNEDSCQTLSEASNNINDRLDCPEVVSLDHNNENLLIEESKYEEQQEQQNAAGYFSDENQMNIENKKGLKARREAKFEEKTSSRQSRRLKSMARCLTEVDLGYFESYSNSLIHQEMLADKVRNNAYERAIQAICKEKIVADVGAGSGVLSIMASQAGARHVYGIEYSDIFQAALQNVKRNAQEDKITLIKELAEDVILPVENVEVIISEWMGYFLICEGMFSSVLSFKKRYLSPNGLMIPSQGSIFLNAVRKPEEVSGLLISLAHENGSQEAAQIICSSDQIVGEAQKIFDCDFNLCEVWDNSFSSDFEIRISTGGMVNGLVSWFDVEMIEGFYLSTSPFEPPTHWKQTYLALQHRVNLQENELLKGSIQVKPRHDNHRALQIKVTISPGIEFKGFTQIYHLN